MNIFLSGANITSGGPLQIYRKMLEYLAKRYPTANITAIVANRSLYEEYDSVSYIEIRNYKKFIVLKFYYEYIRFFFISKKVDVDLWLSLNDCTPSVKAKRRAVYCHNATPFYKTTLKDWLHPTRSLFQSIYYSVFYRINLKKNDWVVVQQNWIKNEFEKKFDVPSKKIIVNYIENAQRGDAIGKMPQNEKFTFIYPTKPQPYKNIDLLLQAVELIEKQGIVFKLILTIERTESKYAKSIFSKFSHLNSVEWIGSISRDYLEELYVESDAMIFCSKLETWGLPITEYMIYSKPIILIDLPYARETSAGYGFLKFFENDSVLDLKNKMLALINKVPDRFDESDSLNSDGITRGLKELFTILSNGFK